MKSYMRFSLFLLLTGITLPLDASAQIQPGGKVNFIMGLPVGEFADNVNNPGFGVDLTGGIAFAPAPVMIGLNAGFLIYGLERRNEPFSTTIPDVTVEVQTTNNIAFGHLFFRVQPQKGRLQPYFDALFGFKYLYTQTSVNSEQSGESIATSVNYDDVAASYGAGAGVDFHVYSKYGERSRPVSIAIHIGARYLLGGSADYVKNGAIRREEGSVFVDVTRSRTDLITPMLGASFRF